MFNEEIFDEIESPYSIIVDDEFNEFLLEEISDVISASEIDPVQKKTRKKTTKQYINNEEFCNSLIEYNKKVEDCKLTNKPKPRLPNYIGECFIKIAEGMARKPNFFNYTIKDIMISDGIENALLYLSNFNPEKTRNAFAYFSQIIFFSFLRTIKKEKKQLYIKYKVTEEFGILDEAELLELGDGQIKQLEVYDNMYDFIQKFEETELIKKEKLKNAKIKPKGLDLFMED